MSLARVDALLFYLHSSTAIRHMRVLDMLPGEGEFRIAQSGGTFLFIYTFTCPRCARALVLRCAPKRHVRCPPRALYMCVVVAARLVVCATRGFGMHNPCHVSLVRLAAQPIGFAPYDCEPRLC